jgi:hypothetical protein
MRVKQVIAVAALMTLLAACTSSAAGQTADDATAGSSGAPTSSPAPMPPAPLRVVRWGANDGMVSVVVQNLTSEEIRSAHAVITARDSRGSIIASVSGAQGSLCCTIVGLLPHRTFGLFADFGPGVARIARVSVDLSQVSVAARPMPGRITASAWQLHRQDGLTLLDLSLASRSAFGPYVAVQAVLTDHSGKRMVAVVSGRFYCLFPGARLRVTMQLFHSVPAGTVVRHVSVFRIPNDLAAVTSALPSCVSH